MPNEKLPRSSNSKIKTIKTANNDKKTKIKISEWK